MESKLKSLKVADLKDILKRASVSPPPKATKADLIAKIIAEPAAVNVYNALHIPAGVTPQQVASSKPKPAAKHDVSGEPLTNPPVSPKRVQDPISPPPKPTTKSAAPTSAEDLELEKRRARAARFGIPLVESKQSRSTDEKSKKQLPEEQTRLKIRAERFGTETAPESNRQIRRKRGAPEERVDPEELERRKKRAERFGVPLAGTSTA